MKITKEQIKTTIKVLEQSSQNDEHYSLINKWKELKDKFGDNETITLDVHPSDPPG